MDSITQEINTEMKYNPAWSSTIAGDIVKKWDKWDSDRNTQLKWIKSVEKLLDMVETLEKDKKGKIKLKDAAIRRIYRTMVARIYNSTFKTPANMFTAEEEAGIDKPQRDFAYKQKQAILNVLKKAKTKQEMLEGIRNLIKKGELISFIKWEEEYNLVRRKTGFKFGAVDLQRWTIQQELKYDGVRISNIDPESFVFDTKIGDFDKAFKINRSWATYESIASHETFKKMLSKNDLQKLQDTVSGVANSLSNIKADKELSGHKSFDNGMIEILDCYGDYTLEQEGQKQFNPNSHIVIIGGEFVASYEYNPYVLNPFIIHAIEKDPNTGRGIPAISGLVPTSIAITEVLNKYYTALGLTINKCWLAPLGTFDTESGEIEIKENAIIQFKGDRYGSGGKANLDYLDFSTGLQYSLPALEYLKTEQQDETQVYRQSAGDSQQQPQTLGQAKLLQQNQDIIESCDNDLFSDNVILGIIEKIASYMANFREGKEIIRFKDEQGKQYTDIIDDEVRQGNYTYIINDSATSIENKMNIMEYMDIILGKIAPYMQQTQQGVISATELVNKTGAAYEIDNPTSMIIQPQVTDMQQIQGGIIGQGQEIGDVPPATVGGLQDPEINTV